MSNTNSKHKPVELTRLKTHIRNDGDNDDNMSFMGSPPLLSCDDPAEYKKLRHAVSESAPADFFEQFCARMFADTLWEARRYQLVTTNLLKAELKHFLDPTVDDETKLWWLARRSSRLNACIASGAGESIVSTPFIARCKSTAPIWAHCCLPRQSKSRTQNSQKSRTRPTTQIS